MADCAPKVGLFHFWYDITAPDDYSLDANQSDKVLTVKFSDWRFLSQVEEPYLEEMVWVNIAAYLTKELIDYEIEELDGFLWELDEFGVEFVIEFEQMCCIDIKLFSSI